MPLPLLLLIFIVSLAVLVKASDIFTDTAERIGVAIGLSPFVVGVTIVSMGTSLPELISSLFSLAQGASEVVASNVIGSNVANICLVIGAAAILSAKSIRVMYDLVSVDLPLFMGSAFLFMLMAWDGSFSRGEALLLVLGYLMYLFYILKNSEPADDQASDSSQPQANLPTKPGTANKLVREFVLLAIASVFIFIGARYTIRSLIELSELLNLGKDIIAMSAVALGTSLPELLVTIGAARKGKAEIAIGNVVGSNIFNIFVVMGIPGMISSLPVSASVMVPGMPTLISTSLLLFFTTQDNKVTIWEGWLFLIIYAWFIGQTFHLL